MGLSPDISRCPWLNLVRRRIHQAGCRISRNRLPGISDTFPLMVYHNIFSQIIFCRRQPIGKPTDGLQRIDNRFGYHPHQPGLSDAVEAGFRRTKSLLRKETRRRGCDRSGLSIGARFGLRYWLGSAAGRHGMVWCALGFVDVAVTPPLAHRGRRLGGWIFWLAEVRGGAENGWGD
jgi:hypothetical protein